jgi:hypothetical protein
MKRIMMIVLGVLTLGGAAWTQGRLTRGDKIRDDGSRGLGHRSPSLLNELHLYLLRLIFVF